MLLEVTGLTVQFGGIYAISGVNVSVSEGEIIGIIGPNGAGKTTFFNSLTGFVQPTAGKILFDGKEIGGLKPSQINKRGLARTFQNIRLFGGMTVLDNVRLACQSQYNLGYGKMLGLALLPKSRLDRLEREGLAKAEDMLRICNLYEKRHELAGSLPYGDQRLLEMARALGCAPKLMLLDEPTAGMDPEETQQMMRMIQKLRDEKGLTILLIEHDMKVVMSISDRVVALDYGKVIAAASPQEVQENPAVIESYLGGGA